MGSSSVPQGTTTNTTQAVEALKTAALASEAAAALEAKLNAMLGIGTFMTAADMFALAEAQLLQTDLEIRGHVKDISVRKEQAAEMQAISAGLREVKNGKYAQQKAKLDELMAKADMAGLPEMAAKLQQVKDDLVNKGSALSSDKLEGAAQGVDAAMNKLTSSAELTMIRIQSLMQHRSQILQLASNVIAALNEPAKNAIGNLRGS